jgi:hypothetical protein
MTSPTGIPKQTTTTIRFPNCCASLTGSDVSLP